MAWTFDADISTDRDRVRIRCFDTDTTAQIFSDGAIADFLSQAGNSVLRASAAACRSIAAKLAHDGRSFRVFEGLAMDEKSLPLHFLKLAASYEKEAEQKDDLIEEIDAAAYEIGPWGGDASEYVG